MPEEIIPDSITPIEAWRVFGLNYDTDMRPVLRPIYMRDLIWLPRERTEAVCLKGHEATPPVDGCMCGLWALKEIEDVGIRYAAPLIGGRYALARVALWGDVIAADGGYRAQFGYPLKIYGATGKTRLDYWADAYGIPFAYFPLRQRRGELGYDVVAVLEADEYIEDD